MTINNLRITTALAFTLVSATALADISDNDNRQSACATLELMAKMTAINLILPANHDNPATLQETQNHLLAMNQLACQSVHFNEEIQFENRYGNGLLISRDLAEAPWYFPNGQIFIERPGSSGTVYYPNGQVMAYNWGRGGNTLLWPNGNPATYSFWTVNEAWYYPTGHIITYLAGSTGERWFYPVDNLLGQVGQEIISAHWGEYGERYQYMTFLDDGRVQMREARISGRLEFSDYDLLDVPGVLLTITRLHQAPDMARQFVPGDSSIAGAPW